MKPLIFKLNSHTMYPKLRQLLFIILIKMHNIILQYFMYELILIRMFFPNNIVSNIIEINKFYNTTVVLMYMILSLLLLFFIWTCIFLSSFTQLNSVSQCSCLHMFLFLLVSVLFISLVPSLIIFFFQSSQ